MYKETKFAFALVFLEEFSDRFSLSWNVPWWKRKISFNAPDYPYTPISGKNGSNGFLPYPDERIHPSAYLELCLTRASGKEEVIFRNVSLPTGDEFEQYKRVVPRKHSGKPLRLVDVSSLSDVDSEILQVLKKSGWKGISDSGDFGKSKDIYAIWLSDISDFECESSSTTPCVIVSPNFEDKPYLSNPLPYVVYYYHPHAEDFWRVYRYEAYFDEAFSKADVLVKEINEKYEK